MNEQGISCPSCRAPLPDAMLNTGVFSGCPACGTQVQCEVFPALYAAPRIGRPGEPLVDASEAGCFFHPEKRAAIACESCGRFLCSLCDLQVESRHICPSCFSSGRKKGKLGNLDYYRTSFAGIALLVATVPFLAWPITVLTAPTALVLLFVGLRKPPSLTGRRRVFTYALALLLSLGQIVAWVIFGSKFWSLLRNA